MERTYEFTRKFAVPVRTDESDDWIDRLIDVHPDYVGFTEISELLGISRQAMRKIMAKNIETFPLPVHEGNPSIWHLKNVLGWMRDEQRWVVDAATVEIFVVRGGRIRVGGWWRLEMPETRAGSFSDSWPDNRAGSRQIGLIGWRRRARGKGDSWESTRRDLTPDFLGNAQCTT